jgi:hypothetical protein
LSMTLIALRKSGFSMAEATCCLILCVGMSAQRAFARVVPTKKFAAST